MDETRKIDLSEGDSNLSENRRLWMANLDADTRDLLDRDAACFLHQSLSTPCINVLRGCGGSRITDLAGRSFLDFHGNSVHQVGFANPDVVAAVMGQLRELSFCTRRYTNETAVLLAEKLGDLAPGNLGKVLFAPGGTSSVGMALKLARVATGRHKTLSMWDSFHGASLDAISIGGEAIFRQNMGPLMPGTEHVPPPEPYRCLFNDEGDCTDCGLKCARYIDYVLEREKDVAALVAEPIRATFITPPPPGYWQAVRKSCHCHGTLLVFDETAVCLGRAGKMFAFENYDVVPDMVVIGKGLGGGIMPFSALIARKDLDLAPDRALGHYTHEKNPVACAAALAAIACIENNGLLKKARTLGRAALIRLEALKAVFPLVGDVRGQGLMFGAELVTDRRTKHPALEAADRIMYGCLEKGLSFKVSKGHFLTLTPPLTITEQDLSLAFDILEEALGEEQRRYPPAPKRRPGKRERKSAMEPLPENPYILLTPGPLSTTKTVKSVMLRDWCTWDEDYNGIVRQIRSALADLATPASGYTTVLMQGSGTFSVEACLTTAIPGDGKLLVLANGAYGRRIAGIAQRQGIGHRVLDNGDTAPPDPEALTWVLEQDAAITHVAVVHCETTTGMLNPVAKIGDIVSRYGKVFIVDAMSSFGGIPMDMAKIRADYLVSSANKCIQGVPGFGFVIARQQVLEQTEGNARSLSLDLFDQWRTMETGGGKWRFTSPTHVVRAFARALEELAQEGGIEKRWERYKACNAYLIAEMKRMGFAPLLDSRFQSPVITAFMSPDHPDYRFPEFYARLKSQGFVIYPGKVTELSTFRIGNIGDIHMADMERLAAAVNAAMYWV